MSHILDRTMLPMLVVRKLSGSEHTRSDSVIREQLAAHWDRLESVTTALVAAMSVGAPLKCSFDPRILRCCCRLLDYSLCYLLWHPSKRYVRTELSACLCPLFVVPGMAHHYLLEMNWTGNTFQPSTALLSSGSLISFSVCLSPCCT